MKKILSLCLTVTLLTLSLLTMTACGKVEGKSYLFHHAKCTWDDDVTEGQKEDFVTIMKVLTGDDTLTTKNVLDKWEDILNENNRDRVYTFLPDGKIEGTFTGKWHQEKDGDLEVTLMGIEMDVELEMGKLYHKVRDYDYIDAVLVFKKK